jgi:hypothetical protein
MQKGAIRMTNASTPNDEVLAHSKLGASSSHRWSACPGSVKLCENIPNRSSAYAEEGTKAHELAASILLEGWPLGVNEETSENLLVYVNYIGKLLSEGSPHTELLVEHRFDLSSVYPGMFGTADAVVFNRVTKHLHVIDLKYGAGYAVEVADNMQLKYYALGALMTCGFAARTVELVIVQPRCPHPDGPIRSFTMPAVELLDYASDLVKFAKATEDGKAPLVPGGHCRFCPASGICPALHSKALKAAELKFENLAPYDPEKLSKTLDMLPQVEEWIRGVREFAYNEARAGRPPPNFKLVEKRATRKWIDEGKTSHFLWNKFGISDGDSYEHKLKSPAKIEALLKAHKVSRGDIQALESLTVKESSGCTLVHNSDKRPPVTPDLIPEFEVVDVPNE